MGDQLFRMGQARLIQHAARTAQAPRQRGRLGIDCVEAVGDAVTTWK